jgi:hypothetical protein
VHPPLTDRVQDQRRGAADRPADQVSSARTLPINRPSWLAYYNGPTQVFLLEGRVVPSHIEVEQARGDHVRLIEFPPGYSQYQGPDIVKGDFIGHFVAELSKQGNGV